MAPKRKLTYSDQGRADYEEGTQQATPQTVQHTIASSSQANPALSLPHSNRPSSDSSRSLSPSAPHHYPSLRQAQIVGEPTVAANKAGLTNEQWKIVEELEKMEHDLKAQVAVAAAKDSKLKNEISTMRGNDLLDVALDYIRRVLSDFEDHQGPQPPGLQEARDLMVELEDLVKQLTVSPAEIAALETRVSTLLKVTEECRDIEAIIFGLGSIVRLSGTDIGQAHPRDDVDVAMTETADDADDEGEDEEEGGEDDEEEEEEEEEDELDLELLKKQVDDAYYSMLK